jgi:hypothetical protein
MRATCCIAFARLGHGDLAEASERVLDLPAVDSAHDLEAVGTGGGDGQAETFQLRAVDQPRVRLALTYGGTICRGAALREFGEHCLPPKLVGRRA